MAKGIDWLYARKSCVTCQKAQDFLGEKWTAAKEIVNGTKIKYGPDEALALLKKVTKLIASKGKTSVAVDLKKAPTQEELLALLIGPTGNLRAPTIIAGNTMYVGFNPDAYSALV